jgi:Flp pilus assembly pilin Flp
MSLLSQLASRLLRDKGQGLVEYALLICLIVIVVGGAVIIFGQYIAYVFGWFVEVIAGWCLC